MPAVYFDSEMNDDDRRRHLYSGDLFILSPTTASKALCELARNLLEEAFAPHDPREIHQHMTAEQVASILAVVKPNFIHHPECKSIIPALMEEHGVDPQLQYFDVPRLRSAYPSDFLTSGIAYAFHPHRDTWYSAPMCQLNWWMPVYPIEPGNAMGFYPRYFHEPVKNNSEIYNYYEWNTKNRAVAAQHVKSDTREQPKPQQSLEPVTLQYIPPPGGTIVFSGAHLHESVPNTTGVARYSIDFRTVHVEDVGGHIGARNIDSRCTGTTMRDYLRCSDLQHLPEELIKEYDDGSAVDDVVLYFGDRLTR